KTMIKSLFTKTTIVLALMCSAYSCTYTSTKSKATNFKIENAKVVENLKALVTFEKVNVNGTETKTKAQEKEQVSTNLEISIINGSNIPSDDVKIKSLAKSIASQFKQELSDTTDFKTFNVVFVANQSNGIVTTNNYTSFTFKSEELSK
ncbi:MAG TPA: hypothetical protein VK783_14230, partial [Bacteroidia bacterium]|nr:hypothetical protein [Bacteroidia bacterium]